MTDSEQGEYNGSTKILKKIDDLLNAKTIPTAVAVRIMLEAQQHAIMENHNVKKRVTELENHWLQKITPRGAAIAFFVLYSFAISDIREPFMEWVVQVATALVKVF